MRPFLLHFLKRNKKGRKTFSLQREKKTLGNERLFCYCFLTEKITQVFFKKLFNKSILFLYVTLSTTLDKYRPVRYGYVSSDREEGAQVGGKPINTVRKKS